jgi:hypothetical protein
MREHRQHSRDLRRQQRICITSRIKARTETRYPYGSLHYTSVNDAVEVEDDFASRRPIPGYLGSGSHYLASDIRLTSHYHDWQSHAVLPVQCTCVQCLFLDVGKLSYTSQLWHNAASRYALVEQMGPHTLAFLGFDTTTMFSALPYFVYIQIQPLLFLKSFFA